MNTNEINIETVVIGGGQAGLIADMSWNKRGRAFVILDAQPAGR